MTDVTSILSSQVLQFLLARHQIIADNIANVNTPAYKAKKLEMPKNFSTLIKPNHPPIRIAMKINNKNHMTGYTSSLVYRSKIDNSGEKKINRNNVSLSKQVVQMSSNNSDYDKALKAYTSSNNLVNLVLGNKGG